MSSRNVNKRSRFRLFGGLSEKSKQKGGGGDFSKYLKDNSEILSVVLLLAFLVMIVYIMMRCVDPAESAVMHYNSAKQAQQAELEVEKEKRAHQRYKKVMKKIDTAIEVQKEKPLFEKENKSLITNLHNNEENLAIQLSSYVNDRGGYQYKGQPENWYVSFAEQARMLYR